MGMQVEPEIRHLDTDPLVLTCERCFRRATWFGVWSCCGQDSVRCSEHASQLNAVYKGAQGGGSKHTPCGAVLTESVQLKWRGLPR